MLSATVNYDNGNAQIEYIPSVIDIHKLKTALQSIGYDLMIDESEETKDQLEEIHQAAFNSLKRKTIASVLLRENIHQWMIYI